MKKIFSSRFQLPLVFAILITALFGGANYQNLLGISQHAYYECDGRMMSEADLLVYRDITLETMESVQAGRGLTYAELCDIPQKKLDRAIFRSHTPKPDHPGEAMEFRRMQLEDENGEIPADAYANALTRMDEMLTEQELGATSAGIENTSWNWIGPGNIGGRVRALVIHPSTPDIMWAGSVSGGIWKTFNGGESWQAQDDFMANLAVTSIVIDPTDSNTLYAGTGEGFLNDDAIRGAWIFKTTDGGATWTQLDVGTLPESDTEYVNRLAISPDGNTLLAATEDGILRSNISSDDELWVNEQATTGDRRVFDINFDPTDSNKAVASGQGYLWYTTNGGDTWTDASFTGGVPEEFGRIEVAYASNIANTVYMSVITEQAKAEIWKSTDGGANYLRQSTDNDYLGEQGWYDNVIWVDPTDANNIIVGGIDLWDSSDGGVTLNKISEWWNAPDSAHADHHIILEHPNFDGTTNKKVFFGNDGGVYRADDVYTVAGTNGWTELNNNFGITQFFGAAGNPTTGDIIGGTQDNGTLFYGFGTADDEKNTEGWIETFGGDGGFSAADQDNSNYFYGEYVYLQIHRSSNGGHSAEYIDGKYWSGSAWEWKAAPYRIDDAILGDANFIAPFILDPNNSNRLLAGGLSLWKTDDPKTATTNTTGPTWTVIKTPEDVTVGEKTYNFFLSAITVAPDDSNTIWLGDTYGDVYKGVYSAGSWSWSKLDEMGAVDLPNRYISRIAVDKNDNDIVYVTFTGFNGDNIYKTTDGGNNWADISGSLPPIPIRSVVINPLNSSYIYIGTELGVFTSENAGGSWDIAQDGPAKVSVDELFFLDNTTLVAATHGRGLYTAKVGTTPSPSYDDFDAAKDISTSLNGAITGISMPYTVESGLDTTNATQAGDDPAAADCNIAPGPATVWYEYTPSEVVGDVDLAIDTKGSDYDTYLALWTGDRGNLTPVACNNDISVADEDSQIGISLAEGTTYYIEAGEYNGELAGASVGGDLVLTISSVVGTVSGTVRDGSDTPLPIEGATVRAAGQSATTDAAGEYSLFPIPADANLIDDLTVTASKTGLSSESQLVDVEDGATTADVDFVLSSADATITVKIGGVEMDGSPYTLEPNTGQVLKYAVDGGPVEIIGPPGSNIIASLSQWRALRDYPSVFTGVAQFMALPTDWVSDTYVLPRYDYTDHPNLYNVIVVSNLDSVDRQFTVTIEGVEMEGSPFTVLASDDTVLKFPGIQGGPVVVSADTGARIIASLYELRGSDNWAGWNGQSEMMGIPLDKLSDSYVIPRYYGAVNPTRLDARIFIANPDSVARSITVKIGGVEMEGSPYTLEPNTGQVLKYAVDGGPVEIIGPPGSNIIASLSQWRALRDYPSVFTGVTQFMALPTDWVSDTYVLPRYDYTDHPNLYNVIVVSNLDSVDRQFTVTIEEVEMEGSPFTVLASDDTVLKFPGIQGGPVVVSADTGARIIASLYELRGSDNWAGWNGQSEMMGIPLDKLSNSYVIPRYYGAVNPTRLDARIFIANP
jgi:photosystem II stability/assembly factor-like uncharacterized protein